MRVTMTWTEMELSMARITVHLFTIMVRGTLTVTVWGMLVFKIVMVNLGSDVGAMSWKFVMIVLNVPYGHVHGHTSAIQRIDIATKVFLELCSGWLGTFVTVTKRKMK